MSENKIEVLRIGYENQVGYLKLMSDVDIKLFFGSITLQLVFANWIAANPLEGATLKVAMGFLEISLVSVSCIFFWLNHKRREHATEVLANFSEELGFLKKNKFGIDVELQIKPFVRPWFWVYFITNIFAATGVCIVIATAEKCIANC